MATKFIKGKYYIGDPCYVFDKSWDSILEEVEFFKNGISKINNLTVLGGNTSIGDGTYYDNSGKAYWVDSGLIALLPISLLKIDNVLTEKSIQDGVRIVNFKNDFTAQYEDGKFLFDFIFIDTTK